MYGPNIFNKVFLARKKNKTKLKKKKNCGIGPSFPNTFPYPENSDPNQNLKIKKIYTDLGNRKYCHVTLER